jgi:hypothetical protein
MLIRLLPLAGVVAFALVGGGCESIRRGISSERGESYDFIQSRRDPQTPPPGVFP